MKKYFIGIDVGGTSIKLGLFTDLPKLIEKYEFPTPKENVKTELVRSIARNVLEILNKHGDGKDSILGIGIGLPSLVEYNGYIRDSANIKIAGTNPAKELSEILGAPVFSAKDCHLAALGEFSHGAGRGFSSIVTVTLGTGLGAGVISEGKLLRSPGCALGEVGHIVVCDSESDVCGCGKRGCLEQYTSAQGIVRLAKRCLAESDEPSVLRDKEITSKAVFDALKAKDKIAIEIAGKFGDFLGRGLATVDAVLDPEAFIIGGGVSKAGEVIFDLLLPSYRKHLSFASKTTEFRIATLGNDAGIYGAAQFAKNNV